MITRELLRKMEGQPIDPISVRRVEEKQPLPKSTRLIFLTAFIIFMLTLFFLSSPRPSFGHGNALITMGPAIDISVEMSKDPDPFSHWHDSVPYRYLDISKMLDPWYLMYVEQIYFNLVQDEADAIEKRKQVMLDRALAKSREENNRFWAAAAFFMMVLLAVSIWFEQYRWKLVDKAIAWRKRKRV